jgi:hypothetical protein
MIRIVVAGAADEGCCPPSFTAAVDVVDEVPPDAPAALGSFSP